jgi:hypothetical protein
MDEPLKDGVEIVKGEIVDVPITAKFAKLKPVAAELATAVKLY